MWWRKEKDFLKRLENAAALGFPAVEIWPWENKDINAVAETCERLGLEIAQFTAWGFKPGLNDPEEPQPVRREDRGGLRGREAVELLDDDAWSPATTSPA